MGIHQACFVLHILDRKVRVKELPNEAKNTIVVFIFFSVILSQLQYIP